MSNKIVLVSDDSNFFDFITLKLELRKSDELFMFNFDVLPEKLHLLESALLIINSENSKEKTLDLLNIIKSTPTVVFAFNDDDVFRRKCYRAGVFDFMTLMTSDSEFRARIIPLLTVSSLLEKNKQYREFLVSKNIITRDSEVFLDYNNVIDLKLNEIKMNSQKAVFGAVSPSDKQKFLLKPAMIEAIILNNIRKNDILMSYAPYKYFIFLFDIDVTQAKKLWEKISSQLSEKIYAGFCNVLNQKREILINEVLNKLHESINQDRNIIGVGHNPLKGLNTIQNSSSLYNFKMFRQEFDKKIEQIIAPVFYQIQQKYMGKFFGVALEQGSGDGYGVFYIKDKFASSSFKITSPGFSKINIDITYQKDSNNIDAKRITLEPEELEQGLLEDLLEQFVLEYKRGSEHDS